MSSNLAFGGPGDITDDTKRLAIVCWSNEDRKSVV